MAIKDDIENPKPIGEPSYWDDWMAKHSCYYPADVDALINSKIEVAIQSLDLRSIVRALTVEMFKELAMPTPTERPIAPPPSSAVHFPKPDMDIHKIKEAINNLARELSEHNKKSPFYGFVSDAVALELKKLDVFEAQGYSVKPIVPPQSILDELRISDYRWVGVFTGSTAPVYLYATPQLAYNYTIMKAANDR